MANSLYNKARQRFITTGGNLAAGSVKILLVDTTEYTLDLDHEFLSNVPVPARVRITEPLTNKTVVNGVFDADDLEVLELVGPLIDALILFVDTGDPATSPLILWMDEGTLPILPNGGDILLRWSNTADRIFRV